MKAKLLTDAMIRRLPAPAAGRVAYPDRLAPGLMLLVNAAGDRRWMVLNYVGGRQAKMAIGSYPLVSLAEARDLARAAREQARGGADPRAARRAVYEAREREAGETFGAAAEACIEAMLAGKMIGGRRPVSSETARERASMLRRLILPRLGRRPLTDITTPEVAALLNEIERDGGPVDRVLQVAAIVFRFAAARGLFLGNAPTDRLARRQSRQKLDRCLSDAELAALWRVAGEDFGFPYGHCLRLLMLTGQRREQISAARWSEVDLERRILTVPIGRNKSRAGAHEVPLSPEALTVLDEAREAAAALGYRSNFVFPANHDSGPLAGWGSVAGKAARNVRLALAGVGREDRAILHASNALSPANRTRKAELLALADASDVLPFVLHDVRATVITRMLEGDVNASGETILAWPLDTVQAVVDHEISAGTTRVYDRSDLQRRFRLRKREALAWWGRRLMRIVDPAATAEAVQLGRR